ERKSEAIISQAMPVLTQVFEERGDHVEQIVVPFTDGLRSIQVAVDLKKAMLNDGREVTKSFEKTIVLALIDESWKEHLREMDELKQSVQNAVYEQKDPLIIYKMEAFNLFKNMLNAVNKEVVSFLYKGGIPVQQEASDLQAPQAPRPAPSRLKLSKPEFASASGTGEAEFGDTREQAPQQPIRKEVTIGRNDPCYCGSGKKYKNCHGAGL
ncbi:MAG TPA: SEC-C metal-binding domain-containing protein, partial [Pedobacter sp.]